jgi:hypothetical protein
LREAGSLVVWSVNLGLGGGWERGCERGGGEGMFDETRAAVVKMRRAGFTASKHLQYLQES